MKRVGRISLTFLLVIAGAFVGVWAYSTFFDKPQVVTVKEEQAAQFVNYPADSEQQLPDLTFAAEKSIHAVVHIATKSVRTGQWSSGNPLLDEFFWSAKATATSETRIWIRCYYVERRIYYYQ